MSGEEPPKFFVCAADAWDLGMFPGVLREWGCSFDLFIRRSGDTRVSFDPGQHCGLILLGDGKEYADCEREYGREMNWAEAAMANGRAVLGICHGSQLLAQLGDRRTRAKRSRYLAHRDEQTDAGLVRLRLTEEGQADPVTRHVPADVGLVQLHSDTFTIPTGAVRLADSANAEHPHCDAFRLKQNVYGLQFHPEPTAEMLASDRDGGWGIRPEHRPLLSQASGAGRQILAAWVRLAIPTTRP